MAKSDIHTWIYPWIYPWISISTATLEIGHSRSDGWCIIEEIIHSSTACCLIDETMTLPAAVCEALNRFIHFEHVQIDSANHFYRLLSR